MEHLKGREQTVRKTNASTNDRVKYFAILTSISPPLIELIRHGIDGSDRLANRVPSYIL